MIIKNTSSGTQMIGGQYIPSGMTLDYKGDPEALKPYITKGYIRIVVDKTVPPEKKKKGDI